MGWVKFKATCAAYGIDRDQWNKLRANPRFVADITRLDEQVKKEGTTFRLRAQLQSEAYLKTSWRMAHDPEVPPNVRADLIKATFRAAGYDAKAAEQEARTALQINIVLGE
jgi:hypothetical protein